MSCCEYNHKMNLELNLGDICTILHPGDTIKIGHFSQTYWTVGYGWFKFDENRSICGWYLTSNDSQHIVKPITDADIIDIYLIEN